MSEKKYREINQDWEADRVGGTARETGCGSADFGKPCEPGERLVYSRPPYVAARTMTKASFAHCLQRGFKGISTERVIELALSYKAKRTDLEAYLGCYLNEPNELVARFTALTEAGLL